MTTTTQTSGATPSQLGAGLGAKPQHWDALLAVKDANFWLEVHAENHMVMGGPRLAILQTMRQRHGLSIHGVGLSLAGSVAINTQHLSKLVRLVQQVQPDLISEHLAWSADQAGYFPDLLPAARTPALLHHVVARVQLVQDALGRPIAIENPSHYTSELEHTLGEAEFLNDLAKRSGCQLLLDLNNVVLSSHNLHRDENNWVGASDWVFDLDSHAISEIHLASISLDDNATTTWGDALWIDSHSSAISQPVWDLYQRFITHAGHKPTLIEWDNNVPAFDTLWQQRQRAQCILDKQKGLS